jgi:ABC-type Zn uptake system ZnuABC Zn-binding protein ZnuA
MHSQVSGQQGLPVAGRPATRKAGKARVRPVLRVIASPAFVVTILPTLVALFALPMTPALAEARVAIVASTNDLASIAASVGGDAVEVAAIARANADPHRVEVLPSYMVRVSRAKLYLKNGLGLDAWADQIIDGSRNPELVVVDCSQGVPVLEKPGGRVDASMGDIHPEGNPHYWLDPRNGAIVARTIAGALGRVDPGRAAEYQARAEEFAHAAEAIAARRLDGAAGAPARRVITYHRSWSYFADAFGLEVVATIEPVPGIPPTGKHLGELVSVIRERNVGLVLCEPYFSSDAGEFLARETGVRVVQTAAACAGAEPGSYLAHFETLLGLLGESKAAPGAAGPR